MADTQHIHDVAKRHDAPLRSRYLRQQAETCLRLSQTCSNRATAADLRVMAAEFFSKALEVENDWLAASQHASAGEGAQRP